MKTPRRVKIAGIGKHQPEGVVTSAALEARLGLAPGWIVEKTGVESRRHTQETQAAMGAAAAKAALQDAGATLADVGLILGACGGPQQVIPSTAVFFQRELGPAADGIPSFDVNATCLSFLAALDVAAGYVASGTHQGVLVIASEKPSVALDWTEEESAVLLGDGAAAVFVTAAAEADASAMWPASFTTHSEGAELAEIRGGGTLHHPNATGTEPRMNLFHMEGPKIFKLTQKRSVPFIARYATELPFALGDLRALVAHQASLFALRMTARACGFTDEQLLVNIGDHGNCMSASIPMVLHDGVRSGRIRRGDPILLAGTAAGISIGAMAMVY